MNIEHVKTTLLPAGRLCAAINLGNPVLAQGEKGDEPAGISVALAHGIAERLGASVEMTCFGHAKEAFEAVAQGKVDIAFLAVDLDRAQQVAFSKPYLQIEGTYLVAESSSASLVGDLDAPGIRIASSKGSAYGLHLERTLTEARLVEVANVDEAVEAILSGTLDAVAGIRQSLDDLSRRQPQVRVLADRFMEIRQAVCVVKRNEAAIELINAVIADMRASGALAAALKASGQSETILA